MIKIVNGHKSDHQKGLLGFTIHSGRIADYLVFSSWRHWLWRSLEGSARNATSNSLPTRYFDQVNKNTSENECPSQKTDPSKNLSLKSQSLFKVGLCFCFFIINIRYLLNEQRTFCVVACKQITGKKWSKKAKLVDVAICVIIELFDRSQMDWRETESSWWVRVWRASIWTLFASTCTDWSWEHFFYMKWKPGNEFRKKFSFISGNWIQFK